MLDSLGYLDTDGDGLREANGENIQLQYYIAADHGSADLCNYCSGDAVGFEEGGH